ncbi:MAG: hypothetical protein KDA99_02690 [Planctomycetales bacterium]|nr:hypothetical protein [Planctomycetales bacterium]
MLANTLAIVRRRYTGQRYPSLARNVTKEFRLTFRAHSTFSFLTTIEKPHDTKPACYDQADSAGTVSPDGFTLLSNDGDRPVGSYVRIPAGSLSTTSIRTQVALNGSAVGLGLLARTTPSGWYQAGYNADEKRLYIGFNGPSPLFAYNHLASLEDVDFDLDSRDLLLQFDLVGYDLSLTAWQPGDPMPSTPQVSYTDLLRRSGGGSQGILLDPESPGTPSSATFRFVHVADSKIVPEPATAYVLAIGIAWLCTARRFRCHLITKHR